MELQMALEQGLPYDNEDPEGDAIATADRIKRQTEAATQYWALVEDALGELSQAWLDRGRKITKDALEDLNSISTSTPDENAELATLKYSKILSRGLSSMLEGYVEAWQHAGYLIQRSLPVLQRIITDEITVMARDFKRNTGFDPVRESFEEAMAIPKPVNYAGTVTIDVVDEFGQSLVPLQGKPTPKATKSREAPKIDASDGGSPTIQLRAGSHCRVLISFVPHGLNDASLARPVRVPLRIEGGNTRRSVPLQVTLDAGFVEVPLQEQTMTVPYSASSAALPDFTFTTPTHGLTPPEMSDDLVPRVAIVISQHGIPYTRFYFRIRSI
jgi:hypothetical protein